jgi:hypothetical protein
MLGDYRSPARALCIEFTNKKKIEYPSAMFHTRRHDSCAGRKDRKKERKEKKNKTRIDPSFDLLGGRRVLPSFASNSSPPEK